MNSLSAGKKIIYLFLPAATLVILICYLIIHSNIYHTHTASFSMAITFDLVIFIPLVYFFSIRKNNIPKITIVPVAILAMLVAGLLLPSGDKKYLKITEIFLAPVEIIAVIFLIRQVHSISKNYKLLARTNHDFVNNLRTGLFSILKNNSLVNVISTEILVMYYGIFSWNKHIEAGNEKIFTYHKRAGYAAIVAIIFFLIILETVSLHILIMQWNNAAAWILTALSVYGLIFLLADYKAALRRPILLSDNHLQIRIAFRWSVTIPLENIKQIYPGVEKNMHDKNYLRMILAGSENIIIELHEPATATGLYGMKKTFIRIGLSIDNKSDFINSIISMTQLD